MVDSWRVMLMADRQVDKKIEKQIYMIPTSMLILEPCPIPDSYQRVDYKTLSYT